MIRPAALAVTFLILAGPAMAEPHAASLDPAKAPAGLYVLDKSHASVTMRLSHMGLSGYTMRFDTFDAHYAYDPDNPKLSKIEATIDANSLDVGEARISQKFAREFLDSDTAPQITFVSTMIDIAPPPDVQPAIPADGKTAVYPDFTVTGDVTGDLTFRGVTKPVTLHVIFNGTGPGLLGGHRMGFSATGEIKRSDFGSHKFESMVGDVVHLDIEAEFQRK